MIPKIGITENHLQKGNSLLSVILSDEMTLYIKTRKLHWNVAGESFMELHKLFEAQYTELEAIIDTVAERIGKLGGKTIGTMSEFTMLCSIVEHPKGFSMYLDEISNQLEKEYYDKALGCSVKAQENNIFDYHWYLKNE